MVESMDEAVGRVLDTLTRLQLAEDTLVIFFSDNGGLIHRSHRGDHTPATSNAPLRSGKGFLYEGGIRVPLIIRWPGVAAADSVCRTPVHGCDLLPTICQAAGISVGELDVAGELDGRGLRDLLRAPDRELPERTLFWHYPHFSSMGGRPSAAIRKGNWKLIEHVETGQKELFDLAADIGETKDLASDRPAQVKRLHDELDGWRDDMQALLPSRANPDYLGPDDLRRLFREPPEEAKPRGYWVWPHGNFDYSAIRSELEAFRDKELGGVDIFDLGVKDRNDVIPPGPGFMSPEQVDGIAFALNEAKRLDLKMGLIVSSSWNAGGTWTTPEHASKNLVAWREECTGPTTFRKQLPLPEVPDSFSKSYGTFPLHVPRDEQGDPEYYRDIAVLAYPLTQDGKLADPDTVRNLTGKVDTDGQLTVELPEGRWVIMRAVLTNFGQQLWLPSDNSQGLTMDHFSREATRDHFQTIIERLEAKVGPLKDTALERLYLASYEANAEVNWTPELPDAFRAQHGYDILPFLPALFGTTVVDQETTERFLYDYRATVSELFLNNLYREASRLCHEHGLLLCSESGGPGAPLHDVPTEDLKALGAVDVMRGEFWLDKADRLDDEGLEVLQVVKQIASAAHIYGHRIVEMEAFTSHVNWQESPADYKRLADRAFCEGMTRAVYHTMSHNLPEAGKPGWTFQAGSHMNTNLTWWELSDQLHAYLARCSSLLMQGQFAADVAYYYGHAIPNFAGPKHVRPGLGAGYGYDDLNTEVLLQASVDPDGRIVLPSGMRYAVLVLPEDDRRMDLDVLRHLELLLLQGATIIGSKPERTYGLGGHPQEQNQLRALADRIWGKEATAAPREIRYGRGRLIVGKSASDVLAGMGMTPDLELHPAELHDKLDFIHRHCTGQDIYFLRNETDHEISFEATFRVRGKHPELWDPADLSMTKPAVYQVTDNGVRLSLSLPPRGSTFVMFFKSDSPKPLINRVHFRDRRIFPGGSAEDPRVTARYGSEGTIEFQANRPGDYELHLSDGERRTIRVSTDREPVTLDGSWELRFPFGWGAPPRLRIDFLKSWTEFDDPEIRFFSGIATYTKQFQVDESLLRNSPRIELDLGEVREVARVFLNGEAIGISSFAPHVLDVTRQIRRGENSLVIEVANTWLNRLIYDDTLPQDQRLTHTNLARGPKLGQRWRDAQPLPSGLIGPVRLRFPRQVTITNW